MQCTTCKREMTQLFFSQACDYCEYGFPPDRLHRGFIVYRENQQETYVFRSRMDAERWRVAASHDECEIREVHSLNPFNWHLSRGTLRDVVLATHMIEIFPDHRYEPLPHRAFLAKAQSDPKVPEAS